MELTLIIPVFNGKEFLGQRLQWLGGWLEEAGIDHECIVVDDGSTDGSADLVESLAMRKLTVIRLPENRGKFAAIRAGVAASRGDVVVFTDADIPYDVGVIPYLVSILSKGAFHLAVGDRTLAGSTVNASTSVIRSLTSRVYATMIRLFITAGLYDTQCGIKGFRGDVARALFPLLREDGFAGDLEILYVALKFNLAVRRVPVHLNYQGRSTVRVLRDGLSMIKSALRVRHRHRRGMYRSDALDELSSQSYEPASSSSEDDR